MRRIALALCLVGAYQSTGKIPITTRSDEARGLYIRARALNEMLKSHDAYALFSQAVAVDPAFAMAEYSLATTAPSAKERSEHLEKALALSSSASPGERLFILGLQARNRADRSRARQLAESLVVQYPRDERAHGALGAIYSAQQVHTKAIAEYEAAIAINPDYSLAYNQLGYAYRSVDNMAAAETAFRKYIALIPNDPNPYDSYAELLMKTGRFDESIAQYRKALSIDSHFGGSYVGIAANHMLAGRHADAIAELRKYYADARDDNERRTALTNEAMVHVDHGGTDAAVAAMERSRAFAAAIGDTANMSADDIAVGDILLAAGNVEAARDRYRQAHALVAASSLPVDVKEDDELARRYDLARVALAKHDLVAARADAAAYTAGAATRKNDARIRQSHELNGLLALGEKQFAASLRELAQADQESPAVWYAMARAYAGTGDAAKANKLSAQAAHANVLPTFAYVFTRAEIAAATRSATSENTHERRR